jgi:hypothetical protein
MTAVFLVDFFMENFNYSMTSEAIKKATTLEDLYKLGK